jgi:hypothetical protein
MKKIPYVSIKKVTRLLTVKQMRWPSSPRSWVNQPSRKSTSLSVIGGRLSLCQTTDDARNKDVGPRKVEQQEAMITEKNDDWRQSFIEYF